MATLATALATDEDLEGHLDDADSDPYGFFEGWEVHSVFARFHVHQLVEPSVKPQSGY